MMALYEESEIQNVVGLGENTVRMKSYWVLGNDR